MNKEMPPTPQENLAKITPADIKVIFAEEGRKDKGNESRKKFVTLDDIDGLREEKDGVDTKYAGRYGKFR